MKKLFVIIFIFLPLAIFSQAVPDYIGFVNDFADVIPDKDEAIINQVVQELKAKTKAEVAVLTVHSMAPYTEIEEFSMAVAEKWKVGSKEDEGIIIVLALEERSIRIEVGYGLEGIITDGKAGRILRDNIIPFFNGGEYGSGLRHGVCKIANIIAEAKEVELENNPVMDNSLTEKLAIFLFVGVMIYIIILANRRRKSGSRSSRRYYGGGFGGMYPGGGMSRGSFGGFNGGGYSSFGGFGSGGGFGGGGFGGGGASGKF